jgi:hypothetical protein
MAKAKAQTASAAYVSKSRKRGKHAKSQSANKGSKNYAKPYKGQGR